MSEDSWSEHGAEEESWEDDDEEASYPSDSSSFSEHIPPVERGVSAGTRAVLLEPSAEITYKSCSYTQIFSKVEFLISNTARLLCVDSDTAQVLLCTFQWNEEKLSSEYFSDPERVLASCGFGNEGVDSPPPGGTVECPVCYDDSPLDDCYSLRCGHIFCRKCYEMQITCQIRDGRDCIKMTCPAFKCSVPVALGTVLAVCTHVAFQQLYVKYLTYNFIAMNHCMRFCPGNGCEQVVYGRCLKKNVECACGESFCFKCGMEAHDPCTCDQLRLWNIKCQDDNDSYVYLQRHTRSCPKCKISCELDALNCGYMQCKSCAAFFCWRCMQVTADHRHLAGTACNKYVPETQITDDSEVARKRTVHYYGRYQDHMIALRKLLTKILPDLLSLRKHALANDHRILLLHLEVLETALSELVACRRVLSYTYVLGYYLLDGKPEKLLYEHQQELLEVNTDALAELVEELQKDQTVVDMSSNLSNAIKTTSTFREAAFATMMGRGMALISTASCPDENA